MLYACLAAFAAAIAGLDQWTKALRAIETTKGSGVIEAIPGLFHITHVKNTGAAWSVLEGQTWLFILAAAAFLVVIAILIWKKLLTKKFELWCVAAIAGGAVGNLIDRIRTGAVTDMIELEFMDFPIFNVADCFVTVGCILLVIYVLFFDREKKKKERADEADR